MKASRDRPNIFRIETPAKAAINRIIPMVATVLIATNVFCSLGALDVQSANICAQMAGFTSATIVTKAWIYSFIPALYTPTGPYANHKIIEIRSFDFSFVLQRGCIDFYFDNECRAVQIFDMLRLRSSRLPLWPRIKPLQECFNNAASQKIIGIIV